MCDMMYNKVSYYCLWEGQIQCGQMCISGAPPVRELGGNLHMCSAWCGAIRAPWAWGGVSPIWDSEEGGYRCKVPGAMERTIIGIGSNDCSVSANS